ncbi:ADYC domain-containing protein [Sorangium sp. So ce448]|uniref:ADYC domain-containing protein n=1 Tax=Sorangium sp. So ce448 TaxID=3133314 RepID=UPI003F5DB3C2
MALFTGSRVETRRAGVCGAAGGASSLRRAERAAVVALRAAAILLGAACVGEEPADALPLVEEAGPLAGEAQVVEIDVELDETSALLPLKECVGATEFDEIIDPNVLGQRWGQQGRTLHGIMDCGDGIPGGRDCEAVEVPRSFSLSSAADADGAHIPDVKVREGKLVSSDLDVAWTEATFQASLRCARGGTLRVAAVIEEEVIPDADDSRDANRPHYYRVMLEDPQSGARFPACRNPADRTHGHLAIPLPGVWNERGNLAEDSDAFTFACVTSTVAKCYDWGYARAGLGGMKLYEACTRMARADYCGTGVSWTQDGMTVGFWENVTRSTSNMDLPEAPGFSFEAAWSSAGALCMHHPRWREPTCQKALPFCDSAEQAIAQVGHAALLFNVSEAAEPSIGLPLPVPVVR